jgi:hypothetical protein
MSGGGFERRSVADAVGPEGLKRSSVMQVHRSAGDDNSPRVSAPEGELKARVHCFARPADNYETCVFLLCRFLLFGCNSNLNSSHLTQLQRHSHCGNASLQLHQGLRLIKKNTEAGGHGEATSWQTGRKITLLNHATNTASQALLYEFLLQHFVVYS